MKKIAIILLCLALLCTFVACDLGGTTNPPDGTDNPPSDGKTDPPDDGKNDPPSDGKLGDESMLSRFSDAETAKNKDFYKSYSAKEKNLYYQLWSDTAKIGIEVDIEPYELAKINEAYVNFRNTGDSTQADTYRKCNLTITVNGQAYRYEEVGIRMRGNTSKRDFCDGDGNIYALVHFRFDLTETFDGEEYAAGAWGSDIAKTWNDANARAERKDRSFATMEKFYFKWNKNYDNTYVREVYANRMFREYGVLAPHITLTQLSLKQRGSFQNIGVGTLYETVDKRFIKRNFSAKESGGDLYKCAYPANMTRNPNYGVETPTQRYAYSLKTNNDRTAPDYNHNKYLKDFINMLDTLGKSDADRQKLEKLVDMQYFTNFEAVNYLLGNPDCIRNNMNNYYMYFIPETGKMYLIPYDYDRCLGINMDWNPSGNGMTAVTPYTLNGPVLRVENPLYTKTILSSGTAYYQKMYRSKIQRVLDGEWFTYKNFQAMFNNYKATYAQLVAPSQVIADSCGGSVRIDRFVMSERGSNGLSGTDDNITTQTYMQLKRQCAEQNLAKVS